MRNYEIENAVGVMRGLDEDESETERRCEQEKFQESDEDLEDDDDVRHYQSYVPSLPFSKR